MVFSCVFLRCMQAEGGAHGDISDMVLYIIQCFRVHVVKYLNMVQNLLIRISCERSKCVITILCIIVYNPSCLPKAFVHRYQDLTVSMIKVLKKTV